MVEWTGEGGRFGVVETTSLSLESVQFLHPTGESFLEKNNSVRMRKLSPQSSPRSCPESTFYSSTHHIDTPTNCQSTYNCVTNLRFTTTLLNVVGGRCVLSILAPATAINYNRDYRRELLGKEQLSPHAQTQSTVQSTVLSRVHVLQFHPVPPYRYAHKLSIYVSLCN